MSAMKCIFQAVNYPEDKEDRKLAREYFAAKKKEELRSRRKRHSGHSFVDDLFCDGPSLLYIDPRQ